MKQGTTPTIEFKLDIEISNVTEVYFTFTDELKYKGTSEDDTPSYLLQKNYPDDATFEDDVFKLPLTQEETDLLTNTFYVEAQVICGTAVVKSDVKKVNMPHTLWTTYVDDNESDGQSEVIHLSFSDNVIVEGSGSSNYNDLTNKPRINNIELIGNKTTSDLGLQPTISGGNGISVSSDVVSVDIDTETNYLKFDNGKLTINTSTLGASRLRNVLADTTILTQYKPLATREYVDNLISTSLKRLVVEQLPQNPNTYTIYMILRSAPTTNNIYDEYMYINNAWELIGSTEVDLSNYYTKTESDNKYQDKLTVGNGIDITSDTISVALASNALLSFDSGKLNLSPSTIYSDSTVRYGLTQDYGGNDALASKSDLADYQPKLTAGTNITIDANNVISASGGGLSYNFTDGLAESSGTVGIDLKSGTELQITNDQLDIDLSSYATTTDLSSKQDTIDSTHKISADLVDDSTSTNKFVPTIASADYGKYLHNNNGTLEWASVSGGGSYSGGDGIDITNDTISVDLKSGTELQITSGELDIDLSNYATTTSVSGKEDKTTISTDTTSTTVSLTLADNHEYRYTQDLTSLTLTMPSGDFIASIVFASGSTPTQMTYDSSIKWSGDDVTNGQFVPTEKTYNIVMWYDGININGVVRGV